MRSPSAARPVRRAVHATERTSMSNEPRVGGLGRGLERSIPTAAADEAAWAGRRWARRCPTAPTGRAAASRRPRVRRRLADHARTDPAHRTPTQPVPVPVPGVQFAELPVGRDHGQCPAAAAGLRRGRAGRADALDPGVRRAAADRRPRPDDDGLRAGHGRAAAARGHRRGPATPSRRSSASTADDAMLRDALLENIHRAQLNPLEEAAAYQQLLEEFGTTHDELAQRIGRSRPQVTNTIRLLNLPVPVQRRVAAGVLSAGHARALLGLDDQDAQEELAARIVAEGLSVRATEELVALHRHGHGTRSRSTPQRRRPADHAPGIAELADRLSDTLRHPGPGRPRPAQGQDHGRVRVRGRPGADRRADGAAAGPTPSPGDVPRTDRSDRTSRSDDRRRDLGRVAAAPQRR